MLVLLLVALLEVLLLWLWSVSLVSCSSAVARSPMLPLPPLLVLATTHRTLPRWPRTLRAQDLFPLRLQMPPILQECLPTFRVTNRHTTLHWPLPMASLKDISSLATVATLLNLKDTLSKVSASKVNILHLMALVVMVFLLPPHLLQASSHPVLDPTRKATNPHKLKSCLPCNLLETRVTVQSSARNLLVEMRGVKGVTFFG